MPPDPQKKRHHYVPICYLDGFTAAGGRIFAYRKDDPFPPLYLKPDEIAFERYYYSQPLLDGGRDNNTIENFFSKIETTWPPIVERIRGCQKYPARFRGDRRISLDAQGARTSGA